MKISQFDLDLIKGVFHNDLMIFQTAMKVGLTGQRWDHSSTLLSGL